eukprot:2346512-Lingulodinium_polyedra.AAC.1
MDAEGTATTQEPKSDNRAPARSFNGGGIMPAPRNAPWRARRPKKDHPHAPASDPAAHDCLHGRAQQNCPTPELD